MICYGSYIKILIYDIYDIIDDKMINIFDDIFIYHQMYYLIYIYYLISLKFIVICLKVSNIIQDNHMYVSTWVF